MTLTLALVRAEALAAAALEHLGRVVLTHQDKDTQAQLHPEESVVAVVEPDKLVSRSVAHLHQERMVAMAYRQALQGQQLLEPVAVVRRQ